MREISKIELLDDLIYDLKDSIDDYEYDIKRGCGRLEAYEKRIRINEMYRWLKVLKTIREEQQDVCEV